MSFSSVQQSPRRSTLARVTPALLVALTLIFVIECVGFNMPFWTTLGASTDSASALNTMGSGLKRDRYGLLEVTDPTQAWLEVKADGSSAYARIDTVSVPKHAGIRTVNAIHVRADADSYHGKTALVSASSPRSLYLKMPANTTIRLWIQEPSGSHIPFYAVRANVRVPFVFSWVRVAIMAAAVALIAAWWPGSRLWRIPLNTASKRQRWLFIAAMTPVAAYTIASIIWQVISSSAPLVFVNPKGYTYDFDQYGHVANALLHGHVWLDLPVPEQLAQAKLPHDTGVRNQLMAQGVMPIYWDYAFYNGHWYSYFGVVPAVLFFLPYQAITSLWVKGGLMLPAGVSVLITMFVFTVFGSLLVIRLVRRIFPNTSLAATSLAIVLFMIGSNSCYLWFRTNFYSVPIAASMMFTVLGLWLWLGATPGRFPIAGTHIGSWRVDGAQPLSLRHLAGGALCIAANFGCRPTFTLAALLGFPLFWSHITSLVRGLHNRTIPWAKALRAPIAVLVPAIAVVAPLMAYNRARFGSVLDFGNAYQMTVTDMTRYEQPSANFLPTLGYYLFMPLRFISTFPYLGISTTAYSEWGYYEPMVGGLFIACPLLLVAVAVPFLKRRLREGGYWPTLTSSLALGLLLMVFDGKTAGLGWRYICDFGWLIALAAIPVMILVTQPRQTSTTIRDTSIAISADSNAGTCRLIRSIFGASHANILTSCVRWLVVVVMLATIVLLVLSCFVVGRDDAIVRNNPSIYATVLAWFRL